MRMTLNGYVVADTDAVYYRFFGYSCFSPKDIRKAVAENPEGEDLTLEINSPGGSVFAGSEMYSVLRSAGNMRTRAEIQSLAASAASYLCLGCGEVMISPVGQMMVHLPATCTEGNRHDHLESVQMLDSVRESILNAYELRARGKADRAEFRRLMNASTFLTAQQAVELGLADGILYQDGETPLVLPGDITNAVGGGIRALANSAGGLPSAAALRERYQQLVDAGKAPSIPEGGPAPESTPTPGAAPVMKDDWRNMARLSLSRARFCEEVT